MAEKKTTEQAKEELFTKHGLTLIGEYEGAHSTLQFLCAAGHLNKAVATNVLRRGYKCKQCLHGRVILPKIIWDERQLLELVELVDNTDKTTEELAVYFNTTTSAINNACAKYNIEKSTTRLTQRALVSVIEAQGRTLISSDSTVHGYSVIKCVDGHEVTQLTGNVLYKDTGCPMCFSADGVSKQEKELRHFIEQNYTGWIEYNDRTILGGKELDIVLPDLGLAIEFNGMYWHSDLKVNIHYHRNKTNEVEDFGYQLIHISDYDWHHKQDIVKSRILAKLNKARRIYARNTIVKQVPWNEIKLFLDQNHIQGAGQPTSTNFALLIDDEIVAVMTFGKPRFSSEDWELIRYCTKLGTTVVGGASKLFKHRPEGTGISYAARDYSTGDLYKKLGFSLSHYTEPGYAYYKKLEKISRYKAQKHKLEALLPLYDPKLSESDNMQLNGYYKVYDSGNMVFTWHP